MIPRYRVIVPQLHGGIIWAISFVEEGNWIPLGTYSSLNKSGLVCITTTHACTAIPWKHTWNVCTLLLKIPGQRFFGRSRELKKKFKGDCSLSAKNRFFFILANLHSRVRLLFSLYIIYMIILILIRGRYIRYWKNDNSTQLSRYVYYLKIYIY